MGVFETTTTCGHHTKQEISLWTTVRVILTRNVRYCKIPICLTLIQAGSEPTYFRRGGADSAPLQFSSVGARRAPKMIPLKSCDVYETNKKRNWADRQKIGVVGPNSKFQANGSSGRKAYFQENSRSRTKIVVARSFFGQST